MSSVDIASVLQSTARTAPARESRDVLRLALYGGELHRISHRARHLHVLSGTAWISSNGRDVVAERGSCVQLVRSRHSALVSALGGRPLLFEMW
jgi:hypothetical protein